MALSASALITVVTARSWLSGLPSVDADVERLIESASRIAHKHSGRVLAATTYTEVLSGQGTETLKLANYPIISMTSVILDSTGAFTGDGISDYEQTDEAGLLHRRSCWPYGYRNIQVVYRAGYEIASIPEDIQQAVVEVMAWTQRRITGNQIGLSNHSYGDESVSYEMTPPVSAQRIFESYRDASIA